jgi:hypothetical protein
MAIDKLGSAADKRGVLQVLARSVAYNRIPLRGAFREVELLADGCTELIVYFHRELIYWNEFYFQMAVSAV